MRKRHFLFQMLKEVEDDLKRRTPLRVGLHRKNRITSRSGCDSFIATGQLHVQELNGAVCPRICFVIVVVILHYPYCYHSIMFLFVFVLSFCIIWLFFSCKDTAVINWINKI